MKTFLREILIIIVLAAAVFVLIQTGVQTFVVVGSSMEPSFLDGQRLLVNKVVYYFHEPERGDVIVFEPVENRHGDYIKRIMGLPGDTLEIKTEAVYVNGSRLDEPYINDPPIYIIEPQKIPGDSYFVLGDNRNNSNDSHNGWVVPRQNIVGKAWLSIWPPDEWGFAANYPLQEQLVNATSK